MTLRPDRPDDIRSTPESTERVLRSRSTGRSDVDMTVVTPTDRVRWGPIVAGMFTAFATFAVLLSLEMAIGLTSYNGTSSARAYGASAGIWTAIAFLIAFFIGGWVAARSSAVLGSSNAVLNGSMVWAIGIPLTMWFLMMGLGTVAATSAASNNQPELRTRNPDQTSANTNPTDLGSMAQQASQNFGNQITAHDVRQAATWSAWGTFIILVLSLVAAALGGLAGTREYSDVVGPSENVSPSA